MQVQQISETNRVMAPLTPGGTHFGRLMLAEGAKKNGRKVVTKRARHPTPKHSHASHDMASLAYTPALPQTAYCAGGSSLNKSALASSV
jgi:hypothetical protein